jgi:hypothetical protein
MLTFNPHKRILVEEALAHPYLEQVNAGYTFIFAAHRPDPHLIRYILVEEALAHPYLEQVNAMFRIRIYFCGAPTGSAFISIYSG